VLDEIDDLRYDVTFSDCPSYLLCSVLNTPMEISLLKSEKSPWFHIYSLCKGLSEKFKCIGNQCGNREVLKVKHALRIALMRAKLKRDTQVIVSHMKQ
jgi:hypothetical protein